MKYVISILILLAGLQSMAQGQGNNAVLPLPNTLVLKAHNPALDSTIYYVHGTWLDIKTSLDLVKGTTPYGQSLITTIHRGRILVQDTSSIVIQKPLAPGKAIPIAYLTKAAMVPPQVNVARYIASPLLFGFSLFALAALTDVALDGEPDDGDVIGYISVLVISSAIAGQFPRILHKKPTATTKGWTFSIEDNPRLYESYHETQRYRWPRYKWPQPVPRVNQE